MNNLTGRAVSVTIACNDRRPPSELRLKPGGGEREWWVKQTELHCPACGVKYGVYVDAGFGHGGRLGWDYVCVNCNKWWIMAIEPILPSGHAKEILRVLKENSVEIKEGVRDDPNPLPNEAAAKELD